MRRRQFRQLNSDRFIHNVPVYKLRPIPDAILGNMSNRLRDKVTNLVQMQIKNNQSNQNFLNMERTNAMNNVENELDRKEKISIFINTKYDIIAEVAASKNFRLVRENEDWNILWVDGALNTTRTFNLKRHQKVNHFPGMNEISRKDKLQKNLKVMQRYFPFDYDIFPRTWNLPNERMELLNHLKERGEGETFIIKPACSSQGRGIILISDVKSLSVIGNTICQVYIANPFLIDGIKFDLRIYVLVTSCDPYRVYVYEEGLARFATIQYEKPCHKNIENVYMHLTNYSVQRNSDRYNTNELSGTKRRTSTIYEWFKNNGYDAEAIWKSIDDVIIKTMLCANNSITHHYSATFPDQYRTSACFELLGFDIILDENLKPYVLEVNHSPSLETETSLDYEVKSTLLNDVFNLVNSVPSNIRKMTDLEKLRSAERLYWSRNRYMSTRKAAYEFRKVLSEIQIEMERCEMNNKNGFRLLYPVLGQTEKYQRFFEFNCENHRNYYNRCVLLDEPEHKKFMEIHKETLPKVMKRSINPMDLSKFNKKTQFDDARGYRHINYSRDYGIKFNLNSMKRKDFYNGRLTDKSNGSLLNVSKASLQKIISKSMDRNGSGRYTDNIVEQSKPANPVNLNSKKSFLKFEESYGNSKEKKLKRLKKERTKSKIHTVHPTTLNEQSSISVEWESSLSFNKVQGLSSLIVFDSDSSFSPFIQGNCPQFGYSNKMNEQLHSDVDLKHIIYKGDFNADNRITISATDDISISSMLLEQTENDNTFKSENFKKTRPVIFSENITIMEEVEVLRDNNVVPRVFSYTIGMNNSKFDAENNVQIEKFNNDKNIVYGSSDLIISFEKSLEPVELEMQNCINLNTNNDLNYPKLLNKQLKTNMDSDKQIENNNSDHRTNKKINSCEINSIYFVTNVFQTKALTSKYYLEDKVNCYVAWNLKNEIIECFENTLLECVMEKPETNFKTIINNINVKPLSITSDKDLSDLKRTEHSSNNTDNDSIDESISDDLSYALSVVVKDKLETIIQKLQDIDCRRFRDATKTRKTSKSLNKGCKLNDTLKDNLIKDKMDNFPLVDNISRHSKVNSISDSNINVHDEKKNQKYRDFTVSMFKETVCNKPKSYKTLDNTIQYRNYRRLKTGYSCLALNECKFKSALKAKGN